MPEEQAPDGLILHSAGQGDQGWYIHDIWESPEHFQRFVDGKLRPAMESTGNNPGGAPPEPQFFPIATLVKGSL